MACRRSLARRSEPGVTRPSPIVAVALMLTACRHAGILEAPPGRGPTCSPSPDLRIALRCHAPILMQETAPAAGGAWDRPLPLDPDGSGILRDDATRSVTLAAVDRPLTVYTRAVRDSSHLFLFYGVYYPAD